MSLAIRWVAVVAMTLLCACASNSRLDDSEQVKLLERATARWEALVAKDWGAAYGYTSPAYKAVFSAALYERKFSYMLDWELTAVEFLNYDVDAAVASVAVRVMSKPTKQTSAASVAIGAVPTRFVEQWVLSDGDWWYSANL
ncbi:MAG: hypothetical protein ACI87W_002689 [Halieaceae bacterium]|jgi:hypothetical protein